mmetsp:Transcript_30392/g.90101  ORF Transcript_30392/g.90101 Transcript_30392/m.90101 type:complete len:95 (-) Transcript_30392:107-391(-)
MQAQMWWMQAANENTFCLAGQTQEAFTAVRPLSDTELSVLPCMVAIRLALSVAMGAASAVADPGNSEYLLTTQRPGWQLLAALHRHGWAMLLPA